MDSSDVPRLRPGALIGTFVGLAGAVCGLVLLYEGMRSVMEIGGACAEGGAFEIRQECPDGVPALMTLGIFGGLICLAIFGASASRLGGGYGRLVAFAWPALFLSLGWNFLEYGLDPPGSEDGPVFGWVFCAVLFGLMGGLPLLFLLSPSNLRETLWPREVEMTRPVPAAMGLAGRVVRRAHAAERTEPAGPASPPPQPFTPSPAYGAAWTSADLVPPATATASSGDLVGRLERLARLRAQGALDEAEYERAKQAVLEGGSR